MPGTAAPQNPSGSSMLWRNASVYRPIAARPSLRVQSSQCCSSYACPPETSNKLLLRSLFASAGPRGAQVDEVAAHRGVVPDPGLVLRVVVENHRADRIPARLEAGPQPVLLSGQDVAQHRAGHLAPAGAFGGQSELTVLERHPPAELLELVGQVRLAVVRAALHLSLEGFAQLAQRRQVVRGQSRRGGPLERAQPLIRRPGTRQQVGL